MAVYLFQGGYRTHYLMGLEHSYRNSVGSGGDDPLEKFHPPPSTCGPQIWKFRVVIPPPPFTPWTDRVTITMPYKNSFFTVQMLTCKQPWREKLFKANSDFLVSKAVVFLSSFQQWILKSIKRSLSIGNFRDEVKRGKLKKCRSLLSRFCRVGQNFAKDKTRATQK